MTGTDLGPIGPGIGPQDIDFKQVGIPGQDYPTKWWEDLIAGINLPEELTAIALGKVLSGDQVFDQSIGNFHRQVGFHTLGLEAGLPPVLAATLGVAAALANPLDPLNVGAIGKLSKAGLTLKHARTALRAESRGAKLLKTIKVDGKEIQQLSESLLGNEIKKAEKRLETFRAIAPKSVEEGKTLKRLLSRQEKELANQKRILTELPERNQILKDIQIKRGLSKEELLKTPTRVEQLRSGERSLLGWVSPLSARNIPFRNLRGFQAAAKPIIGGRLGAAATEAVAPIVGKAGDSVSTGFNAIVRLLRGDRDLRPGVLSKVAADARVELEAASLNNSGNQAGFMLEAERWIRKYGALGKDEQRKIIDQLENRSPIARAELRAMRELVEETPFDKLQEQIVDKVVQVPEGNMASGRSLTPKQELRFSPSQLSKGEIETAIAQWDSAQAKPLRMREGHTYRFDQNSIIVRLSGQTSLGRMSEERLKSIFHSQSMANIAGVPNYRVVVRDKDKFLVARNMPSAGSFQNMRVRTTHIENLGNIAARLGLRRAALSGTGKFSDEPIPILVSPFGGVQVLSPEVFLRTERRPSEALEYSSALIEDMVRTYTTMNADMLNLPMLASMKGARKVGRGARNYIMEPSPTDEFLELSKSGIGHIDTQFLIDKAENTGFIRQLLRGQTPDDSPIPAFLKANEIDKERKAITAAQRAGTQVRFRPIVYTVSPDGRFFIVDGNARLAAAAIEGSPTVPIYKKAYLGEEVVDTGDYYNSYGLRGYDVLDQSHTPPAARKALDEVASRSTSRKASADAGNELRSIQARIGEFSQEKDEILAELGRLAAQESPDDLEMFAAETRLAQIDEELAKLEDRVLTLSPPKPGGEDSLLLPRLRGILDEDYRLLDSEGSAVSISASAIRPSSTEGISTQKEVLDSFRRLAIDRRGPSKTTLDAQWDALRRELVAAYGNIDGATLRIADFAETSNSYDEFSKLLIADMQEQGSRIKKFPVAIRKGTPIEKQKSDLFNTSLKGGSELYLNNLARRGVFTANSISPARAAAASEFRKLTVLFNDGNDLRIINVTKSEKDLRNFAKEYTKTIVDPADVHRLDRIVLQSSEGETSVRFGELVEGEHPRIFRTEPIPTKLKLTEEEKVRLAGKNIFHIAPGEDFQLEVYQNAVGAVNRKTKSMVFFRTRSGDMFVKTAALPKEDSVATLAQEIMGEAIDAIRIQEWGFILNDKIVVNNPIGGIMHTLSNVNLKGLEKQLREMARQFRDMGFSKNLEFEVFTPLSQELWTDIYKAKKRTPLLGDVIDDSFRLRLPKHLQHLEGTPLDINIAKPTGGVRINRTTLQKGVRQLVNWLQKTLDESILSDALNGYPEGWVANYFPRFMPNDTRDVLNKLYANAIAKNPKLRRVVNASDRFKDRKFTDLGTNEVQDLFRESDINMRDILKSTDSARQAEQISAMTKMLPGGLEFFYMDPILATVARRMESFRIEAVSNTLTRLESLENSGLLFKGSSKQLRAIEGRNKELDKVRRRISEQDRILTLMDEQRQTIGVSDAQKDVLKILDENIEKQKNIRLEQILKLDELTEAAVDDHLIAARIPENPDTVWLSGPAARKLHTTGLLDETNMLDHPHSDLVRVRFNDTIRKLTEEQNIDIYFMTPEGSELMSRVFKVQANQQNQWHAFLRGYDRILAQWKQVTLFPIPQFHIRNAFSDAWLMFLGRVGDQQSFRDSMNHLMTITKFRKGNISKAEAYRQMQGVRLTSEATGETLSMEQLFNFGLGQGIAKGQFVMNDFLTSVENAGVMQEMGRVARAAGIQEASRFVGDSFVTSNVAVRKPREFQQFRETWQRFAVFLSEWKKNGDIQDAGMKVKEVFYDYGNLTSFERSTLRRLVPFYSWMRFNTPRMIQTLATEPVLHARTQSFIRNLQFSGDGQPIDKSKLPAWALERGPLVIGERPDGSWMVKSLEGLLPVYDLVPLMHQSPLQFGLNALSPILKVPLEQMVNETFFSGAPIEQVPGQLARSGTLAKLGATRRATFLGGPLPFINVLWNEKNLNDLFRFGKQINQMVDWLSNNPNFRGDKNITLGTMAVEMTIGRVYDIDPRFAGLVAQRRERGIIRDLQRLAIAAEREGNIVARNSLASRLNQLRLVTPPSR